MAYCATLLKFSMPSQARGLPLFLFRYVAASAMILTRRLPSTISRYPAHIMRLDWARGQRC